MEKKMRWIAMGMFALLVGCVSEARVGDHNGGAPCGDEVCSADQECCEDCNICVATGSECSAALCAPQPDAAMAMDAGSEMDAGGDAPCDLECPDGRSCCVGCRGLQYCAYDAVGCDENLNCDDCAQDCGPNAVCCPTCNLQGQCLPLGSTCPPVGESPCECAPMDARGVEQTCGRTQGWKWTGTECRLVRGCACSGADCFNLYDTYEQCHTGCGGP